MLIEVLFHHAVIDCEELEIKLPWTPEELKAAADAFNRKSQAQQLFYGVVGAIGGLLCKTVTPSCVLDISDCQLTIRIVSAKHEFEGFPKSLPSWFVWALLMWPLVQVRPVYVLFSLPGARLDGAPVCGDNVCQRCDLQI